MAVWGVTSPSLLPLMVRRAEWAMSSSFFLPVDDLLRAGFFKGKEKKKGPLGN
jgi:hypothetical protein